MNRLFLALSLLVIGTVFQYTAAYTHLKVEEVQVGRDKDSVQVSMDVNLSNMSIGRSELIWLTPKLVSETDSVNLPTICVYGRNPYYSYVRTGPYANYADIQIRGKRAGHSVKYIQNIEFSPWMDHARLVIVCTQTNSCGAIMSESRHDVYEVPTYTETIPGAVEQLHHALKGTAHIDFVLDKTDIRPDYHGNEAELKRMLSQIDSVLRDSLTTMQRMTLHGYASPEGPYRHNVDLARDRTNNLKKYIDDIYGFNDDFIQTDFTPEDWVGFRRFVVKSSLPHRQQILELIDTNTPPDERLRTIRNRYPGEFRIILRDYFPYLRHTDYTLDYTRREIIRHPDRTDTLQNLPSSVLQPTTPLTQFSSYQPWFALKTNMLFDLVGAFNFEVEAAFGRERLWSAMIEWWTPWYVWHHNSRAYEFQTLGLELRRWFRTCRSGMPPLTGPFAGVYYNNGKYDIEWNSEGDQGEFQSVGLTAGYAWAIHRYLNLEVSLSAGYFWGPRRHYVGMFNDTHLIWQYTGSTHYFGPTKAKVSLVWLIGNQFRRHRQKGGAYE